MAAISSTEDELSAEGIHAVDYEDTEHFRLMRDFLNHRERFFRELFREESVTEED